MLQGKRRLKKEKSSYNTKVAVLAGFLIFVPLIVVLILFYLFYAGSAEYINPLSVNKNSPKISG